MSGLDWFRNLMKTIPKSEQSPELLQSLQKATVMQTFQGDDGSCFAHLSARLFIQNIFKLPDEDDKKNWTKHSTCRKMLNTYRPPRPNKGLTQCGKNGFLKISMFLYLYYHITERFGTNGGSVSQSSLIYPSILRRARPKHFTKLYDPMYTAVTRHLDENRLTPIFVNYVFLDESYPLDSERHTGVVNLLLLFLKHHMYIGCRFYMDNDQSQGHLFMITGFSKSKRAFYVKNTWGTYTSMLYVKDIGKNHISFDGERISARVNMFAFVYSTKDSVPFDFHEVDKKVVAKFKKEFGDTSSYMNTNPFTRKSIF